MENIQDILLYAIVAIAIIIFIVLLIPSGKSSKKGTYKFSFKVKGKTITITNPFLGFLIYGGAGSGKTKSIAKPLMEQYIKHPFAGFIYDYKDLDLTRTAAHLVKKHDYPYQFYIISFVDMDKTARTNPIAPEVIKDENVFLQLLDDLYMSYLQGTSNEWSDGAKGILQGVGYRFFEEFKEKCTIPHIAMFVCTAGMEKLTAFLKSNVRSRGLASAFLDSESSPRTQGSYLSSLTNILSKLSFNKNIAYVLSGDDFQFNLIDGNEPKLISVCNSFQIENVIAPVIALMLSISSRQFTLDNKIPFFYLLDEATTFKIPDFQKMPSVLREYKCSFAFITQSASKIEQMYGRQARSSIESNLGYQFYGRTQDVVAIQSYPLIFGQKETERVSTSKGNSAAGSNKSTTVSKQKENVFDTKDFTELHAGEFICSFTEANYRNGKFQFSQYTDIEEPLTLTNNIEYDFVNENYKKIQNDITFLISVI
ncbi:MAG: type IV secretory system conjugative DNA transfer family protein [Dysgonomonas sp.]